MPALDDGMAKARDWLFASHHAAADAAADEMLAESSEFSDIIWSVTGSPAIATRLIHCLANQNYYRQSPGHRAPFPCLGPLTVGDLRRTSKDEILSWPNLGRKSYELLRIVLEMKHD